MKYGAVKQGPSVLGCQGPLGGEKIKKQTKTKHKTHTKKTRTKGKKKKGTTKQNQHLVEHRMGWGHSYILNEEFSSPGRLW